MIIAVGKLFQSSIVLCQKLNFTHHMMLEMVFRGGGRDGYVESSGAVEKMDFLLKLFSFFQ